jgi:hypothetical protein
MIKGMEKMRTRHAGVEINLILRVKKQVPSIPVI